MVEMKEEINQENLNKDLDEKPEELPEPEISEEEMKSIINYINTWDYEKYERDMEVREALLLLRNKMKQEEEEKERQINELRKQENLIPESDIKKDKTEKIKNYFEKENIEIDNKYLTKYTDNNNLNIFKDELSENEKEKLEKNWNRSTKPEFGEKIINEKGDKEIIVPNINEQKEKKVRKYFIILTI